MRLRFYEQHILQPLAKVAIERLAALVQAVTAGRIEDEALRLLGAPVDIA